MRDECVIGVPLSLPFLMPTPPLQLCSNPGSSSLVHTVCVSPSVCSCRCVCVCLHVRVYAFVRGENVNMRAMLAGSAFMALGARGMSVRRVSVCVRVCLVSVRASVCMCVVLWGVKVTTLHNPSQSSDN